MKQVSVIIPTFNRKNELKKSVESVLQQTFRDFELIIMDDGSSDGTNEMIGDIHDKRIRYIKLEENHGVSVARNEGVRRAECKWIAFQDSDDYWLPQKLEKQWNYHEQFKEYDMIYCPYRFIFKNGSMKEILAGMQREQLEGEIFSYLLERNSIGAPTMLIKKECFLEAGGFDAEFKSLEDWDLAIRFSRNCKIGYVDEILVEAYESRDGISSKTGAYFECRCRMLSKYKKELLQLGLFDQVTGEILLKAKRAGVLEQVEKIMTAFLI